MNKYKQGLEFDDVLIKPIPSEANSRSEVDISVKLFDNFTLNFPLIASPMRGIVNASFASKLSDLGGIAILHRFYDSDEEMFQEAKSLRDKNFGVSIGLNDENYFELLNYNPKILCIDLANGYTKSLLNFCEKVSTYIINSHYKTLLMSGNVCTFKGARNLENSGVNIVRYGIGGGGLCSTRNVTGIGIPQITALKDIFPYPNSNLFICADGGIRNSGDFVKAIVAGANLGMAGSLFGQTFESASNGSIYGMASRKLNEMKYTQIKSIEGIEKAIEKKQSLEQFVEEFSWGIKSAGTYLNAKNLNEIQMNGEFILTGKGSIKDL